MWATQFNIIFTLWNSLHLILTQSRISFNHSCTPQNPLQHCEGKNDDVILQFREFDNFANASRARARSLPLVVSFFDRFSHRRSRERCARSWKTEKYKYILKLRPLQRLLALPFDYAPLCVSLRLLRDSISSLVPRVLLVGFSPWADRPRCVSNENFLELARNREAKNESKPENTHSWLGAISVDCWLSSGHSRYLSIFVLKRIRKRLELFSFK